MSYVRVLSLLCEGGCFFGDIIPSYVEGLEDS